MTAAALFVALGWVWLILGLTLLWALVAWAAGVVRAAAIIEKAVASTRPRNYRR